MTMFSRMFGFLDMFGSPKPARIPPYTTKISTLFKLRILSFSQVLQGTSQGSARFLDFPRTSSLKGMHPCIKYNQFQVLNIDIIHQWRFKYTY